MPCAPMMTAVLMPTTSPCEDTSGPPELPGLRAASVWITSSISRPDWARSERPKRRDHAGGDRGLETKRVADGDDELTTLEPLGIAESCGGSVSGLSMRTSARSVSGSSPTTRAERLRPSTVVTLTRVAPPTTWLLVSTSPSGATITPEPVPPRWR